MYIYMYIYISTIVDDTIGIQRTENISKGITLWIPLDISHMIYIYDVLIKSLFIGDFHRFPSYIENSRG